MTTSDETNDSAASVTETVSPYILKAEGMMGGIKINVRIFQEPAPVPAMPGEVARKKQFTENNTMILGLKKKLDIQSTQSTDRNQISEE